MTTTFETRKQIEDSNLSLFDKVQALNALDAKERAAQLAAEAKLPPGVFTSRAQILAYGFKNDYERAGALERFDREQAEQAEAARGTGLPSPVQVAILQSIRATLATLEASRLATDAEESDTAKRIPALSADLQLRAASTDPAVEAEVLRLVLDERRLALLQTRLAAVPARRAGFAAGLNHETARLRGVILELNREPGEECNLNQPVWSRGAMMAAAIDALLAAKA